MLALFVALQDFAGALDHAARQTGEPCHFDAVAFVRAAGLDAPEKNDFAGRLFDRDMNVLHAGKKIGQFRQFVIVRGEKRTRARVFLEMLDDSPGDGEAVKRGGAAANFIKKNEAGGGRVIKDGRDLAHLDQERRTASREIVAGPDAREDAVGDGKFRLARGNERAHLRHKNNQRSLMKVRGLATHVWTGDEKQLLAARLEAEIVGNEALATLAQKLFNDRMSAADDEQFAGGIEFGAGVAAVGREFGKSGEHVKLSYGGCGAAQARGFCGDRGADVNEKLALDFEDALVGGEDFTFVFLEFGRSEALGVDQRLLALVVGGRKMKIRLGNFDVVTKNLIEANFQ